MAEKEIGIVTHYFGHLGVAAVKLTGDALKIGDTVHVKGHTSDFQCQVDSIQLEHESVPEARTGDNVGIKVPGHAREHDLVFKITP
jgi:putative protease